MKYYKGWIFWNRIKQDDGTLYEPNSATEFLQEADKWWCYFTAGFNKKWIWGYYCLPYDCQGHEALHLGPVYITWSTLKSYERAIK